MAYSLVSHHAPALFQAFLCTSPRSSPAHLPARAHAPPKVPAVSTTPPRRHFLQIYPPLISDSLRPCTPRSSPPSHDFPPPRESPYYLFTFAPQPSHPTAAYQKQRRSPSPSHPSPITSPRTLLACSPPSLSPTLLSIFHREFRLRPRCPYATIPVPPMSPNPCSSPCSHPPPPPVPHISALLRGSNPHDLQANATSALNSFLGSPLPALSCRCPPPPLPTRRTPVIRLPVCCDSFRGNTGFAAATTTTAQILQMVLPLWVGCGCRCC